MPSLEASIGPFYPGFDCFNSKSLLVNSCEKHQTSYKYIVSTVYAHKHACVCVCAYVDKTISPPPLVSFLHHEKNTLFVGTNAVCAAWRPQKGGCFGRGRVGTETWAAGWMCDCVSKKKTAQIIQNGDLTPRK